MFTNYSSLKARNIVSLTKEDEKFILTQRRFDQMTGEEIEANITLVYKEQMIELRNKLQADLDNITELLTDLEALQ
jgi:hypothetical protein